jgi:hypothetical protein
MATPIFQHGKNSFLAVGYDTTSTLATAATSGTVATTSLVITNGNANISGEPAIGASTYGLFVSGIPLVVAGAPSTTAATLLTSQVVSSGICLPMVNLSPYINDIGFPTAIESAETTSFSQAGVKTFIVGLKSYTVTFSGHYDGTATGIDKVMADIETYQNTAGNFVPFVYGVSDPGAFQTGSTANASVKYYGNAILTKYDLKSSVSGVITFDAELQVTGAVTRSSL